MLSRCFLSLPGKGSQILLPGGRCCSPYNPCRLSPFPPHLQHPAAASTPTIVPPPTVPASYFCSTVTAGQSAADTATIQPISPRRWPEARATTTTGRHRAASQSRRLEAQGAASTPWVASTTARIAPATVRHQGWATRGRKVPHGRLFDGGATVAAAESAVAEGGGGDSSGGGGTASMSSSR